jgi:homoserine kinase
VGNDVTSGRPSRAYAPATVANVAAAFDILGFAVDRPGDTVEAHSRKQPGVGLRSITGDGGTLPRDVERNTASWAVARLLESVGSDAGIELSLHKGLPLCSGLGSSAASAAAAVMAANRLLGEPLTRSELLPFVVEAERVACGAAHADNAAPCLLGGFCLVRSTSPLDVVSLPVPDDLCCVLTHPHCEVSTEHARKILRTRVTLSKAVEQWGNVAGLVAGLCTADYSLIGRSLTDVLIEPTRSLLIPGFDAVKRAAVDAGALGCSISGSGPTVFALCRGEERAGEVGRNMAAAFGAAGLDSDVYSSPICVQGARVLDD